MHGHGPHPPRVSLSRDCRGARVASTTFLREAATRADGHGLPKFLEREFRQFLTCGVLRHGLARFHCDGCGFERLVPFSCKGRGFCPPVTSGSAPLADTTIGGKNNARGSKSSVAVNFSDQ